MPAEQETGPPLGSSAAPSHLTYRTTSGARWVIPGHLRPRLAGLRMFVPTSLKGRALWALMASGLGASRDDDADRVVAHLRPQVCALLERDDVELVWYLANRGNETKYSALALGAPGNVVGYFKLAKAAAARRSLAHERSILEALEARFGASLAAPRPLAWRESETAASLQTTAAPWAGGPRRFGPLHARYLREIERHFGADMPFADTPMWHRARAAVEDVGRMSVRWQERFASALAHLERTLAPATVHTTLAHRDFVPWNTRLHRRNLFVFDWEFAAQGYPASHDYFHFQFMTALLLGGGATGDDARQWVQAMPDPSRHGPSLLVAYLLDLALQYHGFDHEAGQAAGGLVLEQAAALLDPMLG